MASSLSNRIASLVAAIPKGHVATYGQIAALAGNPRAARAVVWVLRNANASGGSALPWHRVVSSRGCISLPRGNGFEEQQALLQSEGVETSPDGRIDLDQHLWRRA